MERNDLEQLLTRNLKPLGFKKKGNWWRLEEEVLTKVLNLQKSQFGNLYYINFGLIINNLKLNGANMHYFTGLSSSDYKINSRIKDLLDFDNNLGDEVRRIELETHMKEIILPFFSRFTSENDLRKFLIERNFFNDLTKSVLDYLNIKIQR